MNIQTGLKAPSGKKPAEGAPAPHFAAAPAKLIGITATGPVYFGQRQYVIVPFNSAFGLLQELALRVDDPSASVVSSLASRVSGEVAYRAWVSLSTEIVAPLTHAGGSGRIAFLRQVLAFVRAAQSVDGLEPVLMSAVNAAWPWMSAASTDRVLEFCASKLKRSEFSSRHVIPVVDPSRCTVSVFGKGDLARLDLEEWRADRSLHQDQYVSGREGLGPRGDQLGKSPMQDMIDQLFGGQSHSDAVQGLLGGGDDSGAPGGLPSIGDLPGGQGQKKKGSSRSSLEDVAAGLLGGPDGEEAPGGLPSLGSLPGKSKGGPRDSGSSVVDELLASMPGSEWAHAATFLKKSGASGFRTGAFEGATPGGPFAPPGQLGVDGEGAEGWDDAVRDISTGVAIAGAAVIAVYLAPAAVAEAPAVVLGGAVAATGLAAGALIGLGAREAVEAYKEAHPEPPKDKPQPKDHYPTSDGDDYKGKGAHLPDRDGDGGGRPDTISGEGSDPARLPDRDGDGGGRPNTISGEGSDPARLPDYDDAGGGRPNTIWDPKGGNIISIWDDTYGGSGPTVSPESFYATSLIGPGLRANLVQVGPATMKY